MLHRPSSYLFAPFVAICLTVGCDEVPSRPEVPERLRVVLVTAATGAGIWSAYEIDEEGVVHVVKQSDQRIDDVTYTSFHGTDGAIAYRNEAGTVFIRDIGSGNESVVGPYGPVRFSFDGSRMAYVKSVETAGSLTGHVFVLNRVTGEETQLTQNECAAPGSEPVDCTLGSDMPVFGADDAIYMLRRQLDDMGTPEDAVLEATRQGFFRELFSASPSEITLRPRSFHQNTVLVDFARVQQGVQTGSGFLAIAVATGAVLENDVDLELASFCYDGSVVGLTNGAIRIVDVAGQHVGSILLPEEYGTPVGLQCSLTPKTRS